MRQAKVGQIVLSDKIYIKKDQVYDEDSLVSLFTYDTGDDILQTYDETDTHFIVPSNSFGKLKYESYLDNRVYKKAKQDLNFAGELRWEQKEVVDKFHSKGRARSGIVQAPCGWGKTFTGVDIIARNNVTTLVMVHTKLLFTHGS